MLADEGVAPNAGRSPDVSLSGLATEANLRMRGRKRLHGDSASTSMKSGQCRKFTLGLFRRGKKTFLLKTALLRLYLDDLGLI